MSDTREELKNALGEFINRRTTVTVFPAMVTSVNEGERTCDVTDSEGIEYFDVRLQASVDDQNKGWVLIPAVDSAVLVGNIGNSQNVWFVVATSNITKAMMQVSNTRYQLDASGILLQRNEQTLKSALFALIDQIKLLTVTCAAPGSPSTVPINAAAFDTVKTFIDEVLN
ncbi:MAG: hypothetical protein EPGJADBJ_04483 [Saprospiraceae bacterium]|nr:hypothetical protein [Saprospiraceae bacterium]